MILLIALTGMIGYVLIALVHMSSGKQKQILKNYVYGAIFTYLVLSVYVYVFIPALIIQNILLLNGIGLFIALLVLAITVKKGIQAKPVYTVSGILLALLAAGLIACVAANFAVYKSVHQNVVSQTEDEAEPFEEDQTPIAIAPSSVRNKMNKKMSAVPDTQLYQLGSLQTETVNSQPVYIAPVEFDGFFKWLKGGTTSGHFVIDATDIGAQPTFVEDQLTYVPSAYFHHDLQRLIYAQYPSYIQEGEARLEIDEEGNAWYVQTLYKPKFLTYKASGNALKVAVVNPYTGDSAIYDTDKAPSFIENTVSPEMAEKLNTYYGEYAGGFWNRYFGKSDVKIPNDNGTEHGVTPVFDENGNINYFTDFKSPKENIDSALGYSMVNGRTGEVTFYGGEKNNGIMDSTGAVQVVEKEYPEKKWEGKMPVLYNIDGYPTWVVSVLDSNGIFKQYAYVRADNSDYVVFGDNAKETLQAYRTQLATDPSAAGATEDTEKTAVSGEVERLYIYTDAEGQQTVQFLLTDRQTIFSVPASEAPYAVFMKEGDQVTFEAAVQGESLRATLDAITIKGVNEAD